MKYFSVLFLTFFYFNSFGASVSYQEELRALFLNKEEAEASRPLKCVETWDSLNEKEQAALQMSIDRYSLQEGIEPPTAIKYLKSFFEDVAMVCSQEKRLERTLERWRDASNTLLPKLKAIKEIFDKKMHKLHRQDMDPSKNYLNTFPLYTLFKDIDPGEYSRFFQEYPCRVYTTY